MFVVSRTLFRLASLAIVSWGLLAAFPAKAAEPVTITFSGINHVAPNRQPIPPFSWKGVEFSGGWLRETDSDAWYVASPRSAIRMKFPAGSTDISFNVGGYGSSIILCEFMPLQVWSGSVGSGTIIQTLPLPPPSPNGPQLQYTRFDNLVTIPGPITEVSIFTARPPSGISNFGNDISIDNVRYTPSDGDPSFTFDIGLDKNEKVLIHNYGDAPHPSALQTDDRKIQVKGTAMLNGKPAAGKTIYFRLLDPADTAAYATHAGDAHTNDNVDGPGKLNGQSSGTVQAATDAAGKVSLTLEVSEKVAGDNYQIEASTKPPFACNGPCPKSAVYTAWKRVYVEVNKMFRRGAYIRTNVPPGAKSIEVDNVRPFPRPPFQVRLIHAPTTIGGGTTFYEETVTVIDVKRDDSGGAGSGVLRLNPDPSVSGVQNAYFAAAADPVGAPANPNKTPRPYLADGVGLVTGNRADDYFLPKATLVKDAFAEAFVEHVWLTDAGPGDPDLMPDQLRRFHDGAIPFDRNIDDGEGIDTYQSEWTARKWMRNATRSGQDRTAKANHQVLFTATTHPGDLGFCRVGSGFNDLWIFVKRTGTGMLAAETLVHELAHEWRVNNTPQAGGHCDAALGADQKMYNRNKKCTMHSGMYGNATDNERTDGFVGFHYVRSVQSRDSEYLRIRERDEPIPQNEGDQRPQPE